MKTVSKHDQIANTVIAFGTPDKIKTAALYSEYVLPICFSEYPRELLPPFMDERDGAAAPVILHLLFIDGVLQQLRELGYEDLIKMESDMISITWHGDKIETLFKPESGKQHTLELAMLDEMAKNRQVSPIVWAPGYEGAYLKSSEKSGFLDDLTKHNFTSHKASYFGVDCEVDAHEPDGVDAVLLRISNIPVADVHLASWEQIVALKKDKRSMQQLNKLKEFFTSPFKKKNRQYIESAIKRRIKNYRKICQEHGINTKQAEMKIYINPDYIENTCLPDLLLFVEKDSLLQGLLRRMKSILYGAGYSTVAQIGNADIKLYRLTVSVKKVKIRQRFMTNNKELMISIAI